MKNQFVRSCLAFWAASQLAFSAFTPDDPLFFPGDGAGADPAYYGQWHLINNMPISEFNAGIDANLAGAWAQGWTGSGVIVGVLDDGSQGNHPDLIGGFRNEYSWGFFRTQAQNLDDDFRGTPREADDSHGTSVAGVAVAQGGNGIGMTGAAPFAQLAALRILGDEEPPDGRSFGEVEAAAILFQGQTDINGNPDPYSPIPAEWTTMPVRVKNHSYGPNEGFALGEDYELVSNALKESMDKGVIHVFAAGNQRIDGGSNPYPTADSSKILVTNLPGIINVAALSSTGVYADYSSYGSTVFVTAPSNSSGGFEIATTDRTGDEAGYNTSSTPDPLLTGIYDYNSDFGGTSSAAPLVAGIMALGVEANPDINARMAQHVLARTSVMVDPDDDSATGGWIENAAGYTFNSNYGFGLIDAGAFTETLTQVLSLSDQTTYEGDEVTVDQSFAELTSGNMLSQTYLVEVDPLYKQPLEYILVYLEVSGLETDWEIYTNDQIGTIIGDISAWVESPSGTRHQLFFDDRDLYDWGMEAAEERRDYEDDELEWFFLSYAFWGEDVEGEWIIELYNNTDNDLTGIWESFSFEAGMGTLTLIPEPRAYAFFVGFCVLGFVWLGKRKAKVSGNQ